MGDPVVIDAITRLPERAARIEAADVIVPFDTAPAIARALASWTRLGDLEITFKGDSPPDLGAFGPVAARLRRLHVRTALGQAELERRGGKLVPTEKIARALRELLAPVL
jgi:hypothetical protein